MSCLSIYAGPTALKRIHQEGLNADQFRVMVGASGGPKWFVLYGLDRYLFGEFFAGREQELITLGSSAGAWRICCLATADPVAAIERLATLYSQEQYSEQPTVAEITESARKMLTNVLGSGGAREIAENKIFRTHLVADRCRGLGSSRSKALQTLALGAGALANAVSRKSLSLFFERTIFSNMGELTPFKELADIKTRHAELTEANVFEVMMATGSIPFVLEGVRDITGARSGLYWDGGITDYHFDLPFHQGPELVLYPHFSPAVIPGWFDKHLPWRKVNSENFHNVVLITPSQEFVASLPFGKISDRKDFQFMGTSARLEYWHEILERSKELGAEFANMVENGFSMNRIKAFDERPQ